MLRLHHFLFGNRRLLFVLRLFRGFLRRRLRRLLRERATCTKEKRCGETQKTMRTLHGRQLSLPARNDNWRRAASYARARASSIGSERCSRCVRPASSALNRLTMPVLSHTMPHVANCRFLQIRRAAAHEVFASFSEFRRIAFLWCKLLFRAAASAACAGETRGKAEGRKEAAYSRRESGADEAFIEN